MSTQLAFLPGDSNAMRRALDELFHATLTYSGAAGYFALLPLIQRFRRFAPHNEALQRSNREPI